MIFGPKPNHPLVDNYENPVETSGFITVAGPCSIESFEQTTKIIAHLKELQITYVRGGPWRFGTYPPEKPGLRHADMAMFCELVREAGMKSVIECVDIRLLDQIATCADAIQIGARQMQNYPLLLEAGRLGRVIFLKRAVGATADELLGACEYILRPGYSHPILVERGSVTFQNHVRWGIDVSVITHVKESCKVPIIVDASHGSGRRDLVRRLTLAGVACGADGFLVEAHPEPDRSRSDAEQALPLSAMPLLVRQAQDVRRAISGRSER